MIYFMPIKEHQRTYLSFMKPHNKTNTRNPAIMEALWYYYPMFASHTLFIIFNF